MNVHHITIVEEIAHPETEAIVQAKVDPDPTVGQDINTKTIVLTRATDHDHMIKDTIQTPETDITHLITSTTTIGKDLEVIHLQEAMITKEVASQIREIISARAGQIVETIHFTLKFMLLT